jgi:hypothetical protein
MTFEFSFLFHADLVGVLDYLLHLLLEGAGGVSQTSAHGRLFSMTHILHMARTQSALHCTLARIRGARPTNRPVTIIDRHELVYL